MVYWQSLPSSLPPLSLPPSSLPPSLPPSQPAPNPSVHTKTKSQRIGSTDFQSWDQYDADREAEQVEKETEREAWRVDKTTRVKAVLSESGT